MLRPSRLAALLAFCGLASFSPVSLPAQQSWGEWTLGTASFGDWRWAGPVANVAALPAGSASGTCRWAVAEAGLYCYTGAAWVLSSGGASDAADITYTPAVGLDWGVDPDDAAEALDQLAERLTDEEAKADDDVPEVGDFGALALSGDVTSSGLVTTIAPDTIGPDEMADADHGDVTWAAGAASVEDDSHAHTAGTISGLDAGDTTTGAFADARVDGSLEADEVGVGGDLTGTAANAAVTDDSHAHTGSTVSALDAADVTTGELPDARVADTITASNYLPLAGGTLTGALNIDNAQAFRLFEADANGAHSFTLTAPASLTGDTTCTLAADGRIPDSCVGDGTDGGGAPGGADPQVQFNDGGAFGGDAGLTYNKTTDSLTLGGHVVLNGNQYLYTLGIGDNWRLGASVESGAAGGHDYLTRDKATGYVQYITFGPSGGQGFAIGSLGVGTALEIEAASRVVYLHTAMQLKPNSAPPVTCGSANTEGAIYSDSDGSKALCWCDGTAWVVVAGAGACS